MSKWSRLKAAIFAAAMITAALNWGGCLNLGNLWSGDMGRKIMQLATIADIAD